MKAINKWRICAAAAVLAAACVFGILTAAISGIAAEHDSQFAYKRWSGDGTRYAQISVFLPEGYPFDTASVYSARQSLTGSLESASITASWYEAYSFDTALSFSSPRATSELSVTAVGGGFFSIHRPELIQGYYFRPDDLERDRVVIDEDAAWQLFGSTDVVGLELHAGADYFTVVGVVKRGSDKLFDTVYGTKPRIYISTEAAELLGAGDNISCYEAVLPDPVDDFAIGLVRSVFSGDDVVVIENSRRYTTDRLLETLSSEQYTTRAMRMSAITYPHWENLAVVAQDRAAILAAWKTAALTFMIVVLAAEATFEVIRLRRILAARRKAESTHAF